MPLYFNGWKQNQNTNDKSEYGFYYEGIESFILLVYNIIIITRGEAKMYQRRKEKK